MRHFLIACSVLAIQCALSPASFGQSEMDWDPPTNLSPEAQKLGASADDDAPFDFLMNSITASAEKEAAGFSLLGANGSSLSLIKMAATLVLVLSLFLLFVFVTKKAGARGRGTLSPSIVEIIGQTQLSPSQQLKLVRLGNRILLVATSQQGSQTLSEITDPDEVRQIEAACSSGRMPQLPVASRRQPEPNRSRRKRRRSDRPTPQGQPLGQTLLEA